MTCAFLLALAAVCMQYLSNFEIPHLSALHNADTLLGAVASWVMIIAFITMIANTHRPTRDIPWVD